MIVEDDSTIREELSNLLFCNGYEVEAITNFTKTVTRIHEYMPHLILLDINLPGDDGFSICTKIRSFLNVPIVFVTSRNTDMDELNSIMLGGDAFIIKPYNVAILLAKIYSLLQRYHPNENKEILTYQSVILHLESNKIEFEGKKTDLTKNELKILYYLFKHGGKICPRIDIVANDLPRIFEKGFTGTNGRVEKSSTGIGLYLCKRLCDKLGIGLHASSNEDETIISLVFFQNHFIKMQD